MARPKRNMMTEDQHEWLCSQIEIMNIYSSSTKIASLMRIDSSLISMFKSGKRVPNAKHILQMAAIHLYNTVEGEITKEEIVEAGREWLNRCGLTSFESHRNSFVAIMREQIGFCEKKKGFSSSSSHKTTQSFEFNLNKLTESKGVLRLTIEVVDFKIFVKIES